ncbi:DUF427 domain-containing protein [Alkalilimnicola sp. S0819]|uniref:DUF427 domain-containing protein n=1 Tax=Alkalilimnicola sp. S0819 TaxID=2613922 RepID=UPI00128AFE6E|nr:DUF427 domain-containing protein [Alkalilimnicola sp. S0819]
MISASLSPQPRRVRVRAGDTVLADTTRAMELREGGYPPRQYLPAEDVRLDLLTSSNTVTHCPYKGDARYYSFGGRTDIAWRYDQPPAELQAIAGRIAFYRVELD